MKKLIMFLAFLVASIPITGPAVGARASTDIGWPVEIEATGINEEIPEPIIEEDIILEEEIVQETEALSPVDDTTTGIEDKVVFGEEYDLVNRLGNSKVNSAELTEAQKIYSGYSDVVPVVTTDQMVEWILRKGNELISILQVFAQPFAIIIFIISAAICLIGSLTKGNMASKGLMGMISSALLYTAVLYAPLLVNTFTGFMGS